MSPVLWIADIRIYQIMSNPTFMGIKQVCNICIGVLLVCQTVVLFINV